MITSKDYYRVTNCVGDFRIPEFTIEEVQEFLTKLGYTVIIHKGLGRVEDVEMGWNEVNRTGNFHDIEREIILAVKPNEILPERVDSPQASAMNFLNIFNKEIKKKLLSI